jgi:membrane-bound inhibitor of C-type lysozyme
MLETVVALLMFVNFEIKEHRIQPSMSVCLRGKREAERTHSDTVQYKCIRTKAEVKTNKDGSKYITKIILE